MTTTTTAADIARAGKTDVYRQFAGIVERRPDALALTEGARTRTYGELHDRVLRLAEGLARSGIGRGDRIALLSENRGEYVETELAAAWLGAIVACQNWRQAPAEMQHCIDLVAPKLIIVSARHAALVEAVDLRGVPVITIEAAWEGLLASGRADPAHRPDVDPEDGLVILYTSGTTGMPKGALISHRAEIARNAALRMDLRVTEADGFLAWAPMFHMGSTDQVLGSLMSGSTVHLCDGFDAERIVSIMEENLLGWMLLMPGSIEPVVELLETGRRVKGIRAVGAMADLVPLELIARLSGLTGAPYLNSFGSTETGLPPGSAVLIPPGERPTSLSKRKSTLCEFRLVDPDDREVAVGEPGEAAVRGPTVFSGYWNAPETNAWDFRGGWFHMGDLFRANPDGSFDFVDRSKYMIKSGGENIYPAEIERVLLADPRVSDAVVVKKIDPRWGEVPVAFVSRKDETLDSATIDAMCRSALAGYKRPREVHFIAFDAFPRSTTGKIQRHEMERWLKAGTS
ncbi:class I adenylate-forming enzyme family protein [Pinisolibacter aquiterrae]|uniref:class I adenylate-forming enzyme family protein n=1 Tax=Pinisolibacter aquiterrae TaxID=2815579 RepID=UPI001C3C913A|nr:class I adenylate-forming enzyme family protein [Pinisolibacter aquiterrae]MBV5265884.1 acyl--CoA ligase [Pinisolibacter aquiterrae]MCC8236552.1 acyl--CoA ligase [Pinisolibacter aquiterrae]